MSSDISNNVLGIGAVTETEGGESHTTEVGWRQFAVAELFPKPPRILGEFPLASGRNDDYDQRVLHQSPLDTMISDCRRRDVFLCDLNDGGLEPYHY